MSKDYVPRKDADFDDWFKFLSQYVTLKCSGSPPEWDHIPQDARTRLTAAYADWYTAYSKTFGPRTEVDTLAKNEAKTAEKTNPESADRNNGPELPL